MLSGDLEEVFGAVEAGFGVALAFVAFSGGGGGGWAEDGEEVVPAVGVGGGASFEFSDGQG